MSKARAKGTVGENYFLQHLREIFGPSVERAPLKGTLDHGDFVGVPWLHEAKNTKRPLFMEWARAAAKKAKDEPWSVLWKGDLRKGDGPFVLVPLDFYKKLAYVYAQNQDWSKAFFAALDAAELAELTRVDL